MASGVRSSCEASATKSRIRRSDPCRTANECSIWASIRLSESASEPTSSFVPRGGIRRVRSPAAMAAAVSSIRVSGRKARRTANHPSTPTRTRVVSPMTAVSQASCRTVLSTLVSGSATAIVPPVRPCPSVSWAASTRQDPTPSSPRTVKCSPSRESSTSTRSSAGMLTSRRRGWKTRVCAGASGSAGVKTTT